MAQLIQLNGAIWQEEYADSTQTNDMTIEQFDDILAGAGLTTTAAVGPRWHIDSFGRHSFTEDNDLIDEGDNSAYWIGDQIEAVAGAGFTVLMHRFGPELVLPANRFWTGLQLAVEIP
ncbi:hypothetical protein [Pseudomonas sp. SO81]|uniref:hypothetical protein n=1 Tax=Pseudomonas sp. SO81 TaxID=2983246 RepID=UPI0025A4A868|nr:hypothetical protein [Pseudomonas sp. SO81]WJN61372.1 hypothetical protein OH686_21725 [Pseudomonas sp. SO81]